jgi:hypothetical protein
MDTTGLAAGFHGAILMNLVIWSSGYLVIVFKSPELEQLANDDQITR